MFETLARVMTASTDTLKFRCLSCGHEAEWTREQAFTIFGADSTPYDVRSRAVCSGCRARDQAAVWI